MRLRSLALLSLGLGLAALPACKGCHSSPSDRDPRAFLPKDTQVLLEIKDVRALVHLREGLLSRYGALVTDEQLKISQERLALMLGFDASTVEGLKSAGIRLKGGVVAAVAPDGSAALWVIPVEKPDLLMKTLNPLLEVNLYADPIQTRETPQGKLYAAATTFGDSRIDRAVYAVHQGFLLLAFGRKAEAAVTQAMAQKPEASVLRHPQIGAIEALRDTHQVLRLSFLTGGQDLARVVSAGLRKAQAGGMNAGHLSGGTQKALDEVQFLGLEVSYHDKALHLRGKTLLTPAGQARINAIWGDGKPAPASVFAVDLPETLLSVNFSGRVDTAVEEAWKASQDGEKPPLPKSSSFSTVAISLGLRDLKDASLGALLGDPTRWMWTAMASSEVDKGLNASILSQLGLKESGSRDHVGVKIAQLSVREAPSQIFGESFDLPGAQVFASDRSITEAIIAKKSGRDPLGGKPGFAMQLKVEQTAASLSTFPIGSLPILYRTLVARALLFLGMVDHIGLTVLPTKAGVDTHVELRLNARTEAQSEAGGEP